MHKILVLYSGPADGSAFTEYYVNKPLPVAARLPGMKAARYSFEVSGVGASGSGSPYFAVFEGEFDSQADFAAAVSGAEGQALLADVPNFATGGVVVANYPCGNADWLSVRSASSGTAQSRPSSRAQCSPSGAGSAL
jgi:uncharacterized protein (TIGR02118 family)